MLDDQPSRTAMGVCLWREPLERPTIPGGDTATEAALARDLRGDAEPRARRPYFSARTQFFDEAVLRAVAGAPSQVVLVGAGYDCRALRFRHDGVRFFELDHPATQRDKLRRLAAVGADATDVVFVELDLLEADVAAALAERGHDPTLPTLFVCEGLLVYLEQSATETLFRSLASCAAPGGGELVTSVGLPQSVDVDPAANQRFSERLVAIGEPAMSRYTAAEISAVLEATGWTVDALVDPHDLDAGNPAGRSLLVRASIT